YRETIYYTNKAGEIFYTDKSDGKTKRGLPGYNILNAICMMTTEKGLLDQAHEDKVVKVYDFDAKAEVPKSVQVLVDTVGKPLRLAISNSTVNVKTKQDGEYVSTAKTKQENKIESVFHAETKQTLKEAIDGRDADFHDKWLERNKGQIF